jgi:hypothetical protein
MQKNSQNFTIVSLACSALLLSGCSSEPEVVVEPVSFSGEAVTLALATNTDVRGQDEAGGACFYPDELKVPGIFEGVQVKLSDSEGKLIGLSELGAGGLRAGWTEDGLEWVPGSNQFVLDSCVYPFEFSDLILEDEFYSIQVGEKDETLFSKSDLLESSVLISF